MAPHYFFMQKGGILVFVNSCVLDMRSKKVLGIPIVAKLTKKGAVSSIFTIPYKHIASHLSNVRGNFQGQGLATKGAGMERLISYSCNFYFDDWYSVEAVKVFFDIEVEDDIDKNVIAWYNPYMKKITGITDAYKNPIAKCTDITEQVLKKYLQKESDINKYFVDISQGTKYYAPNRNSINSGFKSPDDMLKTIERFKTYFGVFNDDGAICKMLDSISKIPLHRFMEASVFATIKKTLALSYLISDNYISGVYSESPMTPDEIASHIPNQERYRVAYNLFCQNSILAFQALLDFYGCAIDKNIGEIILNGRFQNISHDKQSFIYTDSLYRILGLCISYMSVGTCLLKRAKTYNLEEMHLYTGRFRNYAFDNLIGWETSVLSAFFSDYFYDNRLDFSQLNRCSVSDLNRFVEALVKHILTSKYVASNGSIIACYDVNGKEYYRHVEQK